MKKIIYFICFMLLFVSCKSVAKENKNLTGMVVDEKNRPISNFTLSCKDEKGKIVGTAVTGENGFFVFYDVGYGNFIISGKKHYYTKIENEPFTFAKQSDFCACQVMSFEEAMMRFIKTLPEDSAEARRILDSVYQEPFTPTDPDPQEE